jgi:outer membrane lipase/esterase
MSGTETVVSRQIHSLRSDASNWAAITRPSPVSFNIAKLLVEHRLMRRAWTFATGWRHHGVSRRACAVRACWIAESVFLAFIAVNAFDTACAAGLNQFVGFGDSTMDSGYFRYSSTGGLFVLGRGSAKEVDAGIVSAVTVGASGAFVGPGMVSTKLLAARFGLSALPVTLPGGSGTNYANGSAQTVPTTPADGYRNGFFNNVPTVAQISNYLTAVHQSANPDALYMISTGANELLWMQTQQPSLSPQQLYDTYMKPWSATLATSVATLQADGARTIVVLNLNEYARLVDATGHLTAAGVVGFPESQTYGTAI